MVRQCSRCGITKNDEEFEKKTLQGLKYCKMCKTCRTWFKNKIKIWRMNNQDKYEKNNKRDAERRRKYFRNWWKEAREKCLIHYGSNPPKCACCGETIIEFLSIDHINGGGIKQLKEIKSKTMYYWLIKNNFPEGFQVLCHNCNFAKGHYGECPHQKLKN